MTAFTTSMIPASVNSLEKLVAWSNGAFYSLHRNTEYQETEGGILVPIVTAQDGKAANKTERFITRTSTQLTDNWREDPQPFWVNAVTISSAEIPTAFKA
ncbi:MAG: hypothetical protein WBA99_03150 [Nodosilinea sp.]